MRLTVKDGILLQVLGITLEGVRREGEGLQIAALKEESNV